MAKNTKQIVHDLQPLASVISELSTIISDMLDNIETHTRYDDSKIKDYFIECNDAVKKLSSTSILVKKYIENISAEVNNIKADNN